MLIAVHPCGQVVDFLRRGYRSKMRTIHGVSPVDVVWYAVPKGRKVMSDRSVFRSRHYVEPAFWDGIGEQEEEPQCCGKRCIEWYDSHTPNPASGLRRCGTNHVWRHGATLGVDVTFTTDRFGLAPCCHYLPIHESEGGEKEGGFGVFPLVMVGGEAEGGFARFPLVAAGGEKEGGRATFPLVAFGGEVEGGSARWLQPLFVSSGGEVEGGWAGWLRPMWITRGGEVEGGWAGWLRPLWITRGGEVEGGWAGWLQPLYVSQGGEVEGGSARWSVPIFVAQGGEVEGRRARWLRPLYVSQGGEVEGGRAGWLRPTFVTRGGEVEGGEATYPTPDPDPDLFTCLSCPSGTYSVWDVVASGFGGAKTIFNGTWSLPNFFACNWQVTVGTTTVSFAFDMPSSQWRITFQDGLLSATFALSSFGCTGTHTANFVSEVGPGSSPSSVTMEPGI